MENLHLRPGTCTLAQGYFHCAQKKSCMLGSDHDVLLKYGKYLGELLKSGLQIKNNFFLDVKFPFFPSWKLI